MVSRAIGAVIDGIDARIVDVEADIGAGLPGMSIVGLADTAVSESRTRVRAAVANSGATWPERKVTVALLPASWRKRGSSLDLAIALAVLAASGQVPEAPAAGCLVVGELGLDGSVRPVTGVIAIALAARRAGITRLLVPTPNAGEAALLGDIEVGGVDRLAHLVAVLRGERAPDPGLEPATAAAPRPADLADVRGQPEARRALEISAAGGHHLSMIGSPGVGKTMLAERLPGLLPALEDDAALEVTAIRSVAGMHPVDGLVRVPPFEAPHHSASHIAIVGGGQGGRVRVGAVTLAHRGVLFLDEAPEFDRPVLESLRQPLESGSVRIARADIAVTLPARFHLVIAANPCPCGKGTGRGEECSCTPMQRRRYAARLSGPLLDRVDLRLLLERPGPADLDGEGEPSEAVADRVRAARERARARWAMADLPWRVNADVPGPLLRRGWPPHERGARLLADALARGALTLRGADRVLRVAWTLADLAGTERPRIDDIAYAMSLRGTAQPWAA